jgi:hypothetical protein
MGEFTLPDLCDFPGVGPPLIEDESVVLHHLNLMGVELSNCDSVPRFMAHYDAVLNHSKNCLSPTKEQLQIFSDMRRRVEKCVDLFFKEKQLNDDIVPGYSDGYEIYDIGTDDLIEELQEDVDAFLDQPNQVAAPHYYDRFLQLDQHKYSRVYIKLQDRLEKVNAIHNAQVYSKRKMKVKMITLHVCTPSDTHYNQTLRDLPTTSDLVNLHMDPKYGLMKAIVYLNHVTSESGPFSVIPDSNHWRYDRVEELVARGHSTANYVDTPLARECIRVLPKRMRKNVILGRYILNGSDDEEFLGPMEKKFTSNTTNCIVFDPVRTLHRGGICKSKNRINLQVVLK